MSDPRRPSATAEFKRCLGPALLIQLVHCGGQGLSVRDGGSESDGTIEGGSANEGAAEAAPGCFGSQCPGDAASFDPPCDGGWQCAVDTLCSTQTSLSGKVFDPAGLNPLYNVIVYIPNDVSMLPPITPGTSACTTCNPPIVDFVAVAVTDASGSFTLTRVPTGVNVPVTVQIGKWRRTVALTISGDCAANVVADGALRLPRRKSEGDMPQMALLTGGCDDLGCFLTSLGIDPSEFTAPHAGGRVDVYQGLGATGNGAGLSSGAAGDCTTSACPLWTSKQSLEGYDVAILSCECGENNQTKPPAAMQALHDWLDEGGQVLASHFQYTWFKNNPQADFQSVATWLGPSVANGSGSYDIDTATSLKAEALGNWLGVVGALDGDSAPPALNLANVATSVSTVNWQASRWVYDPSTTPNDTKYLSFETPIRSGPAPGPCNPVTTAPQQFCGKAVFADLDTSGSPPGQAGSVPLGCPKRGLTPQQKALEFLFFDQVECVVESFKPPLPPAPCDGGGD